MTFTKLEMQNGDEVFVNPDYVRYVTKDKTSNTGGSVVLLAGANVYVKEGPKEVVMKMIHDSHTESAIRL